MHKNFKKKKKKRLSYNIFMRKYILMKIKREKVGNITGKSKHMCEDTKKNVLKKEVVIKLL